MLSWSVVFLTLTCLSALFGFCLGPEHLALRWLRWLQWSSLAFLLSFVFTFLHERRSRRS